MTTRGELKARVRSELNDAGAARLWSDSLIEGWIGEAIRAYGRSLPREAVTTLASVAGQADYALPADTLAVLRVEHPEGIVRVGRPGAAGEDLAATLGWPAYDVYAGTLTLRPAPGRSDEAIRVRYQASYPEPAADGDLLATPPAHDDLLVWQACFRALAWIGTDEAKRQRFERERGVSAAEAATEYRARYAEAVRQIGSRVAGRRLLVSG